MSRRAEMPRYLIPQEAEAAPVHVRLAVAYGWREAVAIRNQGDFTLNGRTRWVGVAPNEVGHREITEDLYPAGWLIEKHRLEVFPNDDGSWSVREPKVWGAMAPGQIWATTTAPTLYAAVCLHVAVKLERERLEEKA